MKEKIEQKLQENIERILEKKELLPTDVAILKEKLSEIKAEETKIEDDTRRKELLELFNKTI